MTVEEIIDGTALFDRMRAFEFEDDRGDLMLKVWRGTPWMLNVHTGSMVEQEERPILEWCRAHLGAEAHPIHDRPGNWHRGGATVFGWTWYGFATEAMMREFMAAWPDSTEDER